MTKYIVQGGHPLFGEVEISGAKNAAVAIIPAALLVDGVCRIENIPQISDVTLSLKILERIRKEECGSSAEDRGSIMTVLATDLPVSERQLYRIIRRCGVGIARTGAYTGHGSGEIMIGFTTANRVDTKSTCEVEACARIKEEKINEAFEAAAEAVEEAILNSMVTAKEKRGMDEARYRSLAEFLETPGFQK